MAFIKVTSPHAHRAGNTGNVMLQVLLATLPGVFALTWFFGFGTLSNLILCSVFCLSLEAAALKLRGRSISFYLRDYSALVTAVLLGIALPPYAPWWLLLVGCFFSIIVAKHLYGGLGFNPFNPAMVGYVVLLISFPLEMTQWILPIEIGQNGLSMSALNAGLGQAFLGTPLNTLDGFTGATPLDIVKQNSSLTLVDLYLKEPALGAGTIAGIGWEWVNIGFLAGGIYLLYARVFTWHAPISMLITLAILASLFFDGGSSTSGGSPLFHLLSGATMFGAFFIVTDPVTSAVSTKGRVVYGIGVGLILFSIRLWGNYPDAIAFAVLLMNFAAPFIDYYTLPRTYGHKQAKSGTVKK